MPWGNYAHVPQLLNLCSRTQEPQLLNLCSRTQEPQLLKHAYSGACVLQEEKSVR